MQMVLQWLFFYICFSFMTTDFLRNFIIRELLYWASYAMIFYSYTDLESSTKLAFVLISINVEIVVYVNHR